MILVLWLALLSLSVIVCLLGYSTDDEPYLPVGLAILFLLSIVIITDNLEYRVGEEKNITFSYTNDTLTSQAETTLDTYTAWNDNTSHKVGWLLAVISALGFALSLRNAKAKGAESQ